MLKNISAQNLRKTWNKKRKLISSLIRFVVQYEAHVLALVEVILVLELRFVGHFEMAPHPLLGVGDGRAEFALERFSLLAADLVLLAPVGIQTRGEMERP